MIVLRGSQLTALLFALVSTVFMQLALAGGTCIEHARMRSVDAIAIPQDASAKLASACDHADISAPTTCAAHTQTAYQSLDRHQAPQIKPFVVVTTMLVSGFSPTPRQATASFQAVSLQRTTAQALAIRHCCFRI
ncbi:hypothetical protein CR155_16125 [Pollutimonas nitritireducens]|uniref:Uncharacterized protein n=1 Tax=Pollutimonas nitritireducens TaxID=2045209 RepID=A0A2N4UD31_9BURK|nr:hypothetical protein CR155_16125 [Pollutimonas nitritireducens]